MLFSGRMVGTAIGSRSPFVSRNPLSLRHRRSCRRSSISHISGTPRSSKHVKKKKNSSHIKVRHGQGIGHAVNPYWSNNQPAFLLQNIHGVSVEVIVHTYIALFFWSLSAKIQSRHRVGLLHSSSKCLNPVSGGLKLRPQTSAFRVWLWPLWMTL